MRILLRAKRELNWIACFNASKAEASRQADKGRKFPARIIGPPPYHH